MNSNENKIERYVQMICVVVLPKLNNKNLKNLKRYLKHYKRLHFSFINPCTGVHTRSFSTYNTKNFYCSEKLYIHI